MADTPPTGYALFSNGWLRKLDGHLILVRDLGFIPARYLCVGDQVQGYGKEDWITVASVGRKAPREVPVEEPLRLPAWRRLLLF